MTISAGMWDAIRALAHRASHQIDTRPGVISPGKIAAVWAKYHAEIEAVVRAEKLQPIHIVSEREALSEKYALFWWNPKGGWPLPHFHLADDIYPANEKQWGSFSAQVLTKVGASLQKANVKVGFDEFVQITEAAPQV